MTNREWISKGNTGCVFATLFSKNPDVVGWKFYDYKDLPRKTRNDICHNHNIPLIISIEFPGNTLSGALIWNKELVKIWAVKNGFYLENTSDETEGLRINCPEGKAWVQYFGPDSHVVTRQSPVPMLMWTRKLNKSHYVKVGFKGVLHLAHAYYDKISERVYDLLWDRSHKQTEKKIGHKLGIKEAAKTTFYYKKQ